MLNWGHKGWASPGGASNVGLIGEKNLASVTFDHLKHTTPNFRVGVFRECASGHLASGFLWRSGIVEFHTFVGFFFFLVGKIFIFVWINFFFFLVRLGKSDIQVDTFEFLILFWQHNNQFRISFGARKSKIEDHISIRFFGNHKHESIFRIFFFLSIKKQNFRHNKIFRFVNWIISEKKNKKYLHSDSTRSLWFQQLELQKVWR